MTGKTHITLGIAAALLLTHPAAPSGVLAAAVGGALGGRIVDIDSTGRTPSDTGQRGVRTALPEVLLLGALLAADGYLKGGLCQSLLDRPGPALLGGLAGLLLLLCLGFRSEHRTFTHSLLGMALFCAAVSLLLPPLALPFLLGYGSHLLADLCNLRGLQLFFPLRRRVSLGLCPYNQRANRVLFWVTLGVDVAAATLLLIL